MRDPVETNTTVSAFVESSYTLHVAQVVDPHDVIPHETPHEILLAHEIVYGLSTSDPIPASLVSRPSSVDIAVVRKLIMSMPMNSNSSYLSALNSYPKTMKLWRL